jgi:Tol biopolymer transport system component
MRLRFCAIVVVAVLGLSSQSAYAAPRYSEWSSPQPLSAVNTSDLEFANAISKDGLTFYFQRGDAAISGEDIWIVSRASTDGPWGTPTKLPATINTSFNERAAFESPDGHWLYFASDRPGGAGSLDLYVSWRQHTHDDDGWKPAEPLTALNTSGFDSGPTLFEEGSGVSQFYWVANPSGPLGLTADVYATTLSRDRTFGPIQVVTELNSPASEGRPYLSHNGLEIYLQSNRPGSVGPVDIYIATRESPSSVWSTPQKVPVAATAFNEVTPAISWDGEVLFFSSNRDGLPGEIYYATREKVRGKQ